MNHESSFQRGIHNVEKVTKNDLTIIFKPHANPHTMKKTHEEFQNDRYKTVRGVVLTQGTHCLYIEGENDSSQCGKSDKKRSNNYIQTIHPHTIKETCANFQNNQYKTARGVDGWTNGRMDGQTNGWKLARLSHPAKAGAKKISFDLRKSLQNLFIFKTWLVMIFNVSKKSLEGWILIF